MKKLYKYIVFIIGILVFSACADEELVGSFGENGNNVTLTLSVNAQDVKNIVVSRNGDAGVDAEKLYDVHVYVFAEDGTLSGYANVKNDDGLLPFQNTIKINTKSGPSYIYAVANIDRCSKPYSLGENEKKRLKVADITANDNLTLSELKGMNFNRQFGRVNDELFSPTPTHNIFLMSGYLNDGNVVTINNDGSISRNGSTMTERVIKLYRTLAKNTLTIETDENANGIFTPSYYRLCNVPISGTLVPNTNISNVSDYLTISSEEGVVDNITNAVVESSFEQPFNGKASIIFYYPENLQVAKEDAKTGPWTWQDREENEWNNEISPAIKTFTNASDNAAYIEIYGDYVSNDGVTTANVSYTIHLGDFSKGTDLKDFNVIRNNNYSYKVSVNDVQDIRVEATTKTNEDNPYAEGLVIEAVPQRQLKIDAHYEARVLTFTKESIIRLRSNEQFPGMGYLINIKTPFWSTPETYNVRDNGVYSGVSHFCNIDDVAQTFGDNADYEWVKFVKNTGDNKPYYAGDNDPISKYPCRYPGDGDENNPRQWLNVFELLAELYNIGDENVYTENTVSGDSNSGEVYYTCFIDENYYPGRPWPDYVNQDPRTMLLADELYISFDKNSLYAKVIYSILQSSISTFYQTTYNYPDPNVELQEGEEYDLVRAFGTENIDEEDLYYDEDYLLPQSSGISQDNEQDWNARSSAVASNNEVSWYNNGYVFPVDGKQPLYQQAAKACMSRNRDLNGNGSIDGDEIRWYLAGVEQYRALSYGQSSFVKNPSASLVTMQDLIDINDDIWPYINESGWNQDYGHVFRGRYHYFTCSGSNKKIFWPEESLTNNPAESWSRARLVRCIRTLSNGVSDKTNESEVMAELNGLENPEPYYTFDPNTKTFYLDGIRSTRVYSTDPLLHHNEVQSPNNLYRSFKVAEKDFDSTTRSLSSIINANPDICSTYSEERDNSDKGTWRTPNQKEFGLMVSEMKTNVGNSNEDNLAARTYGTRTRFSGDDEHTYPADWQWNYGWNWHTTAGFFSENGRINVGGGNSINAYIRCVKDVN